MEFDNDDTIFDDPYVVRNLDTLDWCMGLDTPKEQKQAKRYGLVFNRRNKPF